MRLTSLFFTIKTFRKTILISSCFVLALVSCGSSIKKKETGGENRDSEIVKTNVLPAINTGADNFKAYLPLLNGKKIGIVTNQSGLLSNNAHIVDFLLEKNIAVQKIFAPEHGFRGTADAGEHVVDGKDDKTGLPIISLYGDNKKPKAGQLAGIDIMVFDLQDVGARFYTYISSLH